MGHSKFPYEEVIDQRPILIRYARQIVGDRDRAEEVVQEAYLRLGEMASKQALDRPGGYLARIVRNLSFDWLRRTRRQSELHLADGEPAITDAACDHPSPERAAIARDQLVRLEVALGELPERMRIAVEMHRFGGAKLREIAEELHISIPLAHQLVAEGVAHCRLRLEGAVQEIPKKSPRQASCSIMASAGRSGNAG